MKCLIICDSLGIGGAERQLSILVKNLPFPWEAKVWSLGDGYFADDILSAGISVEIKKRKWCWDISPMFDLWKTIFQWHPNIIHSFGYMSTLAALPISKFLEIPLINGSIRVGKKQYRRGNLVRGLLNFSDRVIANSEAGLRAFGVNSKKGRVVWNGFAPDRLTLCDHVKDQKNGFFTAIMVGRMHPMKDFDSFIKSARILASKQFNSHFIALGDGPLREKLMDSTENEIAQGIISFPEPTTEVIPHLKRAHVGVLMTNHLIHAEGISNSIMEYMACGLPVICSEGGGNSELVIDGQTGFLVPSGDYHAVADKLIWLKNHPDKAWAMGKAGRLRILNEFSVEKLINSTVKIYMEFINT
jgi:glycosyltransferase involved in cell wall biosynthesis